MCKCFTNDDGTNAIRECVTCLFGACWAIRLACIFSSFHYILADRDNAIPSLDQLIKFNFESI